MFSPNSAGRLPLSSLLTLLALFLLASSPALSPTRLPAQNTARSDSSRGDIARGESMRSDSVRSDSARSGSVRSDSARSDSARGDSARSNTTRDDITRSNTARSNTTGDDTTRSNTARSDRPHSNKTHSDTSLTAISGTVYDSLSGQPLAGALVQLADEHNMGKAYSVQSDSGGNFHITGVRSGRYLLGFMHPLLDSLGIGIPPLLVDVAGEALLRKSLAIPHGTTIRTLLCTTSEPADSTGLVLGFIRDADTGMPLDSGRVVVTWTELTLDGTGIHTVQRQIPSMAGSSGWYALCGVPTEGPITAIAERGESASGYIEIVVPPRGLLHRDFGIPTGSAALEVADTSANSTGESVRRGTARLSVVVRDEHGKALAGTRLLVQGSGVTGSTNDDGALMLSRLPAGTQTLEARYVGYIPERVTVDLASGRTASVTVTMDKHANTLDAVTVYGKKNNRRHDITGFLERRQHGTGRFLTRADIEERRPFQFTDLMRGIPGLRVVHTSGFDYAIISSRGSNLRGACQIQVYVDGVRMVNAEDLDAMVQPSDITGVEVYTGAGEAPPQYNTGSCGSILIWTSPNVNAADRQ